MYAQNVDEIKVVLTDIRMPFMDGPATIRALQKLDPTVKIIAASGLINSANPAKTNSVSVRAFLPKPYTVEKLLKTLHKVLKAK